MVADHSTPEIQTKTCTKCGETKPETEFYLKKNAYNPLLRRGECIPCLVMKRRDDWAQRGQAINARRRALHATHPEKRREHQRQWQASNPEKISRYNAQRRQQRAENPEAIRAKEYARRAQHQDRIREQDRARHLRDADKRRAQRLARYAAHPEPYRATLRARRAANPERYHVYDSTKRVKRRRSALRDLTVEQWREIKAHYGHRCVYCGRKMHRLTMDHIIPWSKGGHHTASNIVPACLSCNTRKHAGPPLKPVQPLLLTVAPPKNTARH